MDLTDTGVEDIIPVMYNSVRPANIKHLHNTTKNENRLREPVFVFLHLSEVILQFHAYLCTS